MKLQIENGALCCPYGAYSIANLTAKLLYRGDHYNTLEISSNAWSLSQNGNVAKSLTDEGEFTLKVKRANGGVCLALSFKASAQFKTCKGFRLALNGFLPIRPKLLHFNAPQVEDWVRNFEMNSKPFECIKCKINPLMIQVLHSKESLIVFEAIRHIENLKSSFAFFRSRKGCRQLAMNST